MSGDPEFDDFLKRRRPLFRRDVDDGLEPPAELDRIVLRQARDAIEGDRPMRPFGMPRWAAPVAIAATLVIGLSVVFKTSVDPVQRVPEVRVENIAQRIDYPSMQETAPAPPPPPAAEAAAEPGTVVVDLASPTLARSEASKSAGAGAMTTASAPTTGEVPAWRRDARSWQAEIERLRASGNQALADAEQAEFNRQFRAYAVSPDR